MRWTGDAIPTSLVRWQKTRQFRGWWERGFFPFPYRSIESKQTLALTIRWNCQAYSSTTSLGLSGLLDGGFLFISEVTGIGDWKWLLLLALTRILPFLVSWGAQKYSREKIRVPLHRHSFNYRHDNMTEQPSFLPSSLITSDLLFPWAIIQDSWGMMAFPLFRA